MDALKERGIPVLPEMICTEKVTIQGGYNAIERLAGAGIDFSAVVACGDTLAIGAIRAPEEHGPQRAVRCSRHRNLTILNFLPSTVLL